jgi:hypothetical protein
MDWNFQHDYGPEFLKRYGTADNWPTWDQLVAGTRAVESLGSYGSWPNTARVCGIL